MIIWIASYPKSGNTWVRSFLTNYLSDKKSFSFDQLNEIKKFPRKDLFDKLKINYNDFEQIASHWINMQEIINSNKKITFLKTHNAMAKVNNFNFTNSINTKGFIYMVRDPRDVVLSYASHLGKSVEETFSIMKNDKSFEMLDINSNQKMSILGSWSSNYKSWKNCSVAKGLIIKYEDLVSNPLKNFNKIIKYLSRLNSLEIDKNKITESINNTNFKILKKLEFEKGFDEKGSNVFFRNGVVGEWQKNLDHNIVKQIEEVFNKEMLELGYL
jgi:hypothetical protein